jgi:hypothetical protein
MIYKTLSVALATAATASSASAPYYSTYTVPGSAKISPNGIKLYDGRGYVDFVQSQSNIPTLNRYADGSATRQSKTFAAPSSKFTGSNVNSIDYLSDFSVPVAAPPTVFAGWYTDAGVGTVAAYQGLKRTSLAQWSQVQTLSPPAEYDFQSFFGMSIAADQRTQRKLAVGCPGCNSTSALGGQVYVYSPSPSASSWSQAQVLDLSPATDYNRLGRSVDLHENVLLASVDVPFHASSTEGYAAFLKGPKPEDPFQLSQILTLGSGSINAAAVFEETIVLANQNQTLGSIASAGAVYILYPSTEEFKLKPAGKPRPVQWSVQQVLRAPIPALNNHFGSSVSLDRNTLVVTEYQTDSAFVFKREEQSGKWSQQQTLTFTAPIVSAIAGQKLVVGGLADGPDFYDLDTKWGCLMISLEDQFGDGWDTAELVVRAPEGQEDHFGQSCELANPLKFRYCPNLASDGGVYSFSVPDAVKAKFFWELQWGVYDESSGKWYRGQWDTKMDFKWDPSTLSFSPLKMAKVLPTNTTCQPCKTRPTEKPTPALRRLKGGDDSTKQPTVSPAPTLAVSSSFNWRYLNLAADAGKPWFNDRYRGTNYYVSDARGHRLVASGTLCTEELTKQCWLDLPKGDYILRVTGALNTNKAGNLFSYCKGVTPKESDHQMTFRIADDDCSIVTLASQSAVCTSLGTPTGVSSLYLVLNVNVLLYGTAVSTPTSAEDTVFSAALATLLPGVSASDVTLVSTTPSGSGTLVNANVKVSSASGYELLDVDQETSLEALLKDTFTSHSKETSLVAALSAGAVASAFSHVSRAEFVDYRIVDSVEVVASSEVELVSSYVDETTVSYSDESGSSGSSFVLGGASVGYLMAGVGILLVVGLFARQTQSQSTLAAVEETIEIKATGRRDLSQMTTTLTPKDLNELSRMEQEYLKIMAK